MFTDSFTTDKNWDISCEITARGWTADIKNPFSVSKNDVRIASATGVNGDFNSFVIADFFLTNDTIFALYERLPFGQTPTNNYAAFSHLIFIGNRRWDQYHTLKITFSNATASIRWFVDGKEVLKVDRIGMQLSRSYVSNWQGGTETIAPISSINCGFGTFDLLDFFPACPHPWGCAELPTDKEFGLVQLINQTVDGAPSNPYINPRTQLPGTFEFQGEPRLFGQGAHLDLRSLLVHAESTKLLEDL